MKHKQDAIKTQKHYSENKRNSWKHDSRNKKYDRWVEIQVEKISQKAEQKDKEKRREKMRKLEKQSYRHNTWITKILGRKEEKKKSLNNLKLPKSEDMSFCFKKAH